MAQGLWGEKIGMTQIFSEENAFPVTVLNMGGWIVIGAKNLERDKYNAIVTAKIRKKFSGEQFSSDWLKSCAVYFEHVKEIACEAKMVENAVIGDSLDVGTFFAVGEYVSVRGTTRGKGFAGVVKRHGFSGGPASHGPRLGRAPGSLSFFRSQGKVPKGKALPGHMGAVRRTLKNLKITHIEPDRNTVFVKGSIPGNAGSLIYMHKVSG